MRTSRLSVKVKPEVFCTVWLSPLSPQTQTGVIDRGVIRKLQWRHVSGQGVKTSSEREAHGRGSGDGKANQRVGSSIAAAAQATVRARAHLQDAGIGGYRG